MNGPDEGFDAIYDAIEAAGLKTDGAREFTATDGIRSDREFFTANPTRDHRTRRPDDRELDLMDVARADREHARLIVRRLDGGLTHAKCFSVSPEDTAFGADDPGESTLRAMFDHLAAQESGQI